MSQLPIPIWSTILEYLAEHEHRYDPWLWHNRLLCREIKALVDKMIWKRVTVSIDTRLAGSQKTPAMVISKTLRVETIVKEVLALCDEEESDPSYDYESSDSDESEASDDEWTEDGSIDDFGWPRNEKDIVGQGGIDWFMRTNCSTFSGSTEKVFALLEALENAVDCRRVVNRFSVRNHIAVSLAEMLGDCWHDGCSELTKALVLTAERQLSQEECTNAITRALMHKYEGYTRRRYYSTDINSKRIYWMLEQMKQNRDSVEELEVFLGSVIHETEEEKAYLELKKVLATCNSLKRVRVWSSGDWVMRCAGQAARIESKGGGYMMMIPLGRAGEDMTLMFKTYPIVEIDCTTMGHLGLESLSQYSRLEDMEMDDMLTWQFSGGDIFRHLKRLSVAIGSNIARLPDSLETLYMFLPRYGHTLIPRRTEVKAVNLRLLHIENGYDTLVNTTFICDKVEHVIIEGTGSYCKNMPFLGASPFPKLKRLSCTRQDALSLKELVEWLHPLQCLEVSDALWKRTPQTMRFPIPIENTVLPPALVLDTKCAPGFEFYRLVQKMLGHAGVEEVFVKVESKICVRKSPLGIPAKYHQLVKEEGCFAYYAISKHFYSF